MGANANASLDIVQQPSRARMCGFGDKVNPRHTFQQLAAGKSRCWPVADWFDDRIVVLSLHLQPSGYGSTMLRLVSLSTLSKSYSSHHIHDIAFIVETVADLGRS